MDNVITINKIEKLELPKKIVDLLELCKEMDEIDNILDDAKIAVGDICLRNELLMKHMKVLDAYGSPLNELSDNEAYELLYEMTKEVFIDGDWKYMN